MLRQSSILKKLYYIHIQEVSDSNPTPVTVHIYKIFYDFSQSVQLNVVIPTIPPSLSSTQYEI